MLEFPLPICYLLSYSQGLRSCQFIIKLKSFLVLLSRPHVKDDGPCNDYAPKSHGQLI